MNMTTVSKCQMKKCPALFWIRCAVIIAFALCVGGLSPILHANESLAKASVENKGGGAKAGDMTLWYRQPGEKWLDAMPIGNGYMGAMVFGRVQEERIALNESSFWSGRPHDYND